MKMNNKGFSLVELIVVIAIMAILVGVLAPSVIGQVEKSRVSKDEQALDSLASACATAVTEEMTKSGASITKGSAISLGTTTISYSGSESWLSAAMAMCGGTFNLESDTYKTSAVNVTVQNDYRILVTCGSKSILK